MKKIIRIEGLKKRFGSFEVLKGVNLAIPEGKITFIMGKSGAGKSVLLKHIIGLLKPDQGRIFFEGEEVTSLPERKLQKVRKKMGYLFQEGALFDSMTVAENVAFPLKEHLRLSKEELEKRVKELLEAVGLVSSWNKYPSELSGGMKKRVALARTLALKPKVILFDEPTTGLDPILQNAILKLIKQLKETYNLTCVIISHDLPLCLKFGDFIAFLNEGKIVEKGRPENILTSKHPFVKEFIKSGLIELKIERVEKNAEIFHRD